MSITEPKVVEMGFADMKYRIERIRLNEEHLEWYVVSNKQPAKRKPEFRQEGIRCSNHPACDSRLRLGDIAYVLRETGRKAVRGAYCKLQCQIDGAPNILRCSMGRTYKELPVIDLA